MTCICSDSVASRCVLLCHLRSIAAHRITLSGVCLSVCLSGSHTFLVVTHSDVLQATHAFFGMLRLFLKEDVIWVKCLVILLVLLACLVFGVVFFAGGGGGGGALLLLFSLDLLDFVDFIYFSQHCFCWSE